ncbi:MAG: peptidase M22 [Clostridia bacterium]|nr:peptidase M22 [Clostridia bacterium]
MAYYLGIDTSNYTTSAAIYDSASGEVRQVKRLLPVKSGARGLRQSDAVFHHTAQLPGVLDELFSDFGGTISAIGVSDAPRRVEGSYMPCFLVGVSAAVSAGRVNGLPIHKFSHQQGHIMAALHSCGRKDLYNKRFLAFHVSGGTTELLLCEPGIDARAVAATTDLNAGQAVDRVGVSLGYPFPAGKYLDELASASGKRVSVKVKLKDGCCSFSGLENKCAGMLSEGSSPEAISAFCLGYIASALDAMADFAAERYGRLPLVFSGGVMSSRYIRTALENGEGRLFAAPEFSADNAAGTAVLAAVRTEGDGIENS